MTEMIQNWIWWCLCVHVAAGGVGGCGGVGGMGGVSALTLEKQGGTVRTEEQLHHNVCQLFGKRLLTTSLIGTHWQIRQSR